MSGSNGQNEMQHIQRPKIDYTNKDYLSIRQAMLELAREKLPEWSDRSENDPGVVLVELFAYMADILLYYQDRIANESYLTTARERRSVIELLSLIGYQLRPPQPASADLTLLFSDESGEVVIETNTEFKTTVQVEGSPISFRYVRPSIKINLEELPLITYSDQKNYRKYEPLPVVQVDAVIAPPECPPEVIGSSDGSPGQRYALARTPLIAGSLEIRVDDVLWEPRSSLVNSYTDDLHYIIRYDENDITWIEFGDNIFGRIPHRGYNNIQATYRVGGGAKGNVPSNTITVPVTPVTFIGEDKTRLQWVYNLNAASGGAEHEACEEAILSGPQLFRARSRAVTAQDYEAYAREFGVGKVRARAPGWNVVELYVAPAGGGIASDTLRENLRLYFEDKRMLTTIIEVKDPAYTPVRIEGDLYVDPAYPPEKVRQQVEMAVSDLLAFDHVSFGDRLFISKIYEVIEQVAGVAGVTIDANHYGKEDPITGEFIPAVDGLLNFEWNEIPCAKYPQGIQINHLIRGDRRG